MSEFTFKRASDLSKRQIRQAAAILSSEIPHGWETTDVALAEIEDLIRSGALLCFAMIGEEVVGFGGMIPQYGNVTYELHPLVVKRSLWKQGIGKALLFELEDMVRDQGGQNVYLGSDDEFPDRRTSLRDVDLYDDLLEHLKRFQPGDHPTGFYQKCGYRVVGVIPDANGAGKPDIFMAKRLQRKEATR
jgi:aminoglycoside 6'-N-acetyltransferase I